MVASRTWWWCLPAVLAVGCANVDDPNVDMREQQAGLVCGMDVLPSPQTLPASACENGRTILGPMRFEAGHHNRKQSAEFDVAVAGDICVTMEASGHETVVHHLRHRKEKHGKGHHKSRHGHGYGHDDDHHGEGHHRSRHGHGYGNGHDDDHGNGAPEPYAAPFVWVDGDKIARPVSFSDDRTEETTVDLGTGSHELKVKIVGQPDAWVDVEVREPFAAIGGTVDMVNADGSLRLTNVATDHPLLTPNGDGHHDDTVFNADVEPLNFLPGKDNGTVDYFLDWEFSVIDLDTCATVDTGITGTTQVNSPTNVRTTWDGTDSTGTLLPNGNYAYVFNVTLVDQFGAVFGSIQSPTYGMIVDASPVDYGETATDLGQCDPGSDPTACHCPGSGGVPGSADPNCSFEMVQHLLPEAGFPAGTQVNYYDPSVIDKSFITTTQDSSTGRYQVQVDLRTYSGGGLISKGDGVWASEAQLRQWVADMTGVPAASSGNLFNFDYVQLGTSTGVNLLGRSNHSFNHFFLDAITDDDGFITVGGVSTDLASAFTDDLGAPAAYQVDGRTADECTENANTNGVDEIRAKFCAYNTAVSLSETTDLGVYDLRSTLFGIEYNGQGTTQDALCLQNGIFSCGIRTVRVPADSLKIESNYFTESGGVAQFTRTTSVDFSDIAAVAFGANRSDGTDGVCSRAVATKGGLAVRMDSADGAVPSTCLINGVFP